MLHLVKHSPYSRQALAQCLDYAPSNSAIVLISDAVVAGMAGSEWATRLFTETHAVYLLKDDVDARGLGDTLHPRAELIDMHQLVDLSAEHVTQMTW
ncbi:MULTISPECIES: sulfurtransferase complex subunit TusB [Salinivibrio]|uniref:Sulfurtransferase TusB n=1 Tax=Salinivibrio siamensis TaxID=414286 RepID=A0ABX3KF40_9GAMM|nr:MULTISPECIES: sulfurtransferase complex subunit TusB [Salinivibrio]OOE68243.1 hypothetical protein BZG20_04730 [Salinivibrio sp. IB868]OOE74126.1 hypothetical protein BZG23_10195 [Salinivibrio sp. ML290]OOE75351.1 hypothetical protein BZG22_05930 [Salinivibrio sp. IB870]OOE80359.1 hypothetical protein BZG25_06115 [Salinivibrio sp. ML198]OOE87503.1 hypothetical protein BZG73_02350 [Salinivibrio siamensis]